MKRCEELVQDVYEAYLHNRTQIEDWEQEEADIVLWGSLTDRLASEPVTKEWLIEALTTMPDLLTFETDDGTIGGSLQYMLADYIREKAGRSVEAMLDTHAEDHTLRSFPR